MSRIPKAGRCVGKERICKGWNDERRCPRPEGGCSFLHCCGFLVGEDNYCGATHSRLFHMEREWPFLGLVPLARVQPKEGPKQETKAAHPHTPPGTMGQIIEGVEIGPVKPFCGMNTWGDEKSRCVDLTVEEGSMGLRGVACNSAGNGSAKHESQGGIQKPKSDPYHT